MCQQIEHGGGHDKPEGVQLSGQRVESPGIDADERDVRRDRAQYAGVLDLSGSGSALASPLVTSSPSTMWFSTRRWITTLLPLR